MGDVLADVRAHELESWWVDLFNDALGEPKTPPGDDLNPLFAYLLVQDVVDLPAFFAAAQDGREGHGLLHGEVDVEKCGEAGMRAGIAYDVHAAVESVERKRGKTLGPFTIVGFRADVLGAGHGIHYRVRSRVIFQNEGP